MQQRFISTSKIKDLYISAYVYNLFKLYNWKYFIRILISRQLQSGSKYTSNSITF